MKLKDGAVEVISTPTSRKTALTNLDTFSFINSVSEHPLLLQFAMVCQSDTQSVVQKDQFTVNVVDSVRSDMQAVFL